MPNNFIPGEMVTYVVVLPWTTYLVLGKPTASQPSSSVVKSWYEIIEVTNGGHPKTIRDATWSYIWRGAMDLKSLREKYCTYKIIIYLQLFLFSGSESQG